jgi:hypothetical protein
MNQRRIGQGFDRNFSISRARRLENQFREEDNEIALTDLRNTR